MKGVTDGTAEDRGVSEQASPDGGSGVHLKVGALGHAHSNAWKVTRSFEKIPPEKLVEDFEEGEATPRSWLQV